MTCCIASLLIYVRYEMSYLRESDIIAIQDSVRLLSINEIDDISHYLFDSHIAEYNECLIILQF